MTPAPHRPVSLFLGLLEVFVNETHDLVIGDVFVELLIVDLDSESYEFIRAILGVIEISLNPDNLGTVT